MKTKLIILFILLSVVSHTTVFSQTCNTSNCPMVGEPYINDCFAGIERYLARSMSMDGLALANDPINNWPSECQDPNYACSEPYSSCPHGGYCPQRYCEDISVLTDLKIAFVRRVAGIWGSENKMEIGNSYYNAAQQAVIDINEAYDCASLRRPIIQAAILEFVSSSVGLVQIPSYVISDFANDSDFDPNLYSGNMDFDACRIVISGCSGTPDLNRIEARMWFYYLATQYIDFGYKGLHMGNIEIMIPNDSGNSKTYSLFQKIRDYAISNNSFVIIDAHTEEDLYLNNSTNLLLDFNSSPIRPIETYSNLLGSACNYDYLTEIVANLGDIYNNSTGGQSPLGCDYEETPYFVEFDHYTPYCGTIGQNHSGNWCVWGYDEMNYFYNLSDGCKLNFIEYAYPEVRDIDYRGFLQFPGRQGVGSWSIPNDKEIYRLYDYTNVKNGIENILQPSMNISISSTLTYEYEISGNYLIIYKIYTFEANNTDDTSVFTWHIKKPNNSWENYTYGESREYRPLQHGQHTIYLRQDNLGLPNSFNGSKTINITVDVPYPAYRVIPLNFLKNNFEDNFDKIKITKNETNFENLDMQYLITDGSKLASIDALKELNNDLLKTKPAVFPNPASEYIYINMNDFGDAKTDISLVDILGRTILTYSIEDNGDQAIPINIKDVPRGVYMLIFAQNGVVFNNKVVVEK